MDVDAIEVLGPMGNDIQHVPAGITNVNVRGYAAANDGGGGQFVVSPATCEDSDDGVAIKQTNLGRCWYRQFTGPIDVAWSAVRTGARHAHLLGRRMPGRNRQRHRLRRHVERHGDDGEHRARGRLSRGTGCRVSLSATSAGAATPVAITSVDRQSYGTTVAFKTTNAVTHIYGGCKPPA